MAVQHNPADNNPPEWEILLFGWPERKGCRYELPAPLGELFDKFLLVETLSIETNLEQAYATVPALAGATSKINV